MKSRIIQAETVEELSRAYMKELRTYNRTKKTYDEIDPYAEVYQFRENLYGIYTQNADGGGAPWIYLVLGPEKAMLIDTGFGIGDLKSLVEKLAEGRELIVVNTHSHRDHAYGNFQFDEVFCHEYAVEELEAAMRPDAWDMLFDENGNNIWMEFDREDIIPFRKYKITGCKNHDKFSLGGDYEMEVIYLGGHDVGQIGILDKKNRILFSGDAFLSMYMILNGPKDWVGHKEMATINAFSAQIDELMLQYDEFDVIFPGHFVLDIDKSVIPNVQEVCKKIIKDPGCYDFKEERKGEERYFKLVRGLGAIVYSYKAILPEKSQEEHK